MPAFGFRTRTRVSLGDRGEVELPANRPAAVNGDDLASWLTQQGALPASQVKTPAGREETPLENGQAT
jgi:hypothetical protein